MSEKRRQVPACAEPRLSFSVLVAFVVLLCLSTGVPLAVNGYAEPLPTIVMTLVISVANALAAWFTTGIVMSVRRREYRWTVGLAVGVVGIVILDLFVFSPLLTLTWVSRG